MTGGIHSIQVNLTMDIKMSLINKKSNNKKQKQKQKQNKSLRQKTSLRVCLSFGFDYRSWIKILDKQTVFGP